ncbi:carboxy terminal-processing peptidase [Colwellia sp. M166]|uniref:carboxy terminal-processing peptidase n=1 Tax=Colwellia sp. M166 TaxID=2583805 RepID=UPI00211EFDC4|nr:carboxy terminal-processing peptidase [Colwellia sp. M166]UUO22343.1 carboxy terminal-processing peptidase [Colwellia sp. M166]|tara:strand:- start:45363 stop:47399 length:2037 start_codon:yes stop_codon:yes gene_type:complete
MHKFCRIAVAVALSIASISVLAQEIEADKDLPILAPESQHATSTKRITAQFTRAHYKKIKIDDSLSEQIFDRYIKQLDYARNVFLASDVERFAQYRDEFDTVIARGKLDIAYQIYNLNLQRRLERYQYALSLLENDQPFDFKLDESYNFDREEAQRPTSVTELNELWRKKVKYDALNLTLAGKEWEKIQEILTKRYRYAIKRLKQSESEDVFQIVMNSFARVVEPHTSYLSPRNAERFQMEMNLSLEGIGAVLRAEEDYTVIQSVVSGGPADKSKELKPKDRIVGVSQDDKDFVDVIGWRLDDVVELIKGPKGSKVRLQILGAESEDDSSIKVVSIIRDTIKLEDRAAKSEVYDEKTGDENTKKLGVITIPSFYNHLSRDVKLEIAKLKEQNVAGIIVDLRGNGGGSLTEATLLTGLFIDKGPVVQVRDGANRVQVNSDKDGISFYDGPLTVMVDRYSASASEIFSAAIQDYGRGVIVGEHTFGKGTVQQHRGLGRVYDLYEKPFGSIQFTIAKFYRINGGSTQHRGVLPDIEFPSAIDPADWGESKEENALPWDQIPKARYNKLNDISQDVSYLSSLHSSRILENKEFNYLLSDIEEYKAEKDDKTISLNLAQRKEKRENRKAKQLKRANERLVMMGKEKVTDLDDLPEDLEALDPFLDETAKITFDLVSLGRVAKK